MTSPISIKEFARTLPEYLVDFNDFIVIKTIGKGGFGEVYLAEHKPSGIQCALKKLTLSEEEFEGQHEKYFIREVDILSKTQNPFLLRLLGFSDHYPFCIATEYISKGSLFDAIHHKPGAPVLDGTQLTLIALIIAMGLESLHQRQIVHRDVKSLNILLDDNLLPHVCDFGISRELNQKDEEGPPLLTGDLGTANWMAPELFNTTKEGYGFKVDVYAYGIMLWEMLTGEVPFAKMQPFAIMQNVMKGQRPKIPDNTPKPLSDLISSCWAQNPDDRPSFDQIVGFLQKHKAEFANTDDQRVDQVLGWLQNQTVVPLTQRPSQNPPGSQPSNFSRIIQNPADPNYESACISSIRSMKPELYPQFLQIIMKNFASLQNKQAGVSILEAIASLHSRDKTCAQIFVYNQFFNYLPYNIAELVSSCNKVYESLIQEDISFVTKELIDFGFRLSQTSPLSSLTGLSNYIYHLDAQFTEYAIWGILGYASYYAKDESSELLIDTLYYFASQKPQSQYIPNIRQTIESFLNLSNERTIDAVYRALIELHVTDFTIPTEVLVRHLRFDSLALSVLLYLTTLPPNLQITPELIQALIDQSQKDQLAVFVLCLFSEKEDLAIGLIQNYSLWLLSARLAIADSLRIFLALMCNMNMRQHLGKIPILSSFFRKVVESRNNELIENIPPIIRRLEQFISPDFILECSKTKFLGVYLRQALELKNTDMLSSAVRIVETLARKAYIPDYLEYIPYAANFIATAGQSDLQQVCVSFLYILSTYQEPKPYLAQSNLQSVLNPTYLPQNLLSYANATLKNIGLA